jgi:superoxide dismutase, Cu-Zn family
MRPAFGLLPFVLVATVAGCGTEPARQGGGQSAQSASPESSAQTVTGTFRPYHEGALAVTYDPAIVPAGATATVVIKSVGEGIELTLTVGGLLPNRAYGSHLHSKPCGAKGDAAGPHFQHQPDPAASASPPSVDPSYANPQNEVWLDFTTDGTGTASARTAHPWAPPSGASRSVVIHAASTKTGPKEAGTAGARAACLTVPA